MSHSLRGRFRGCPLVISIFLLAAAAPAQEVHVYSEFQRIDPFGEVIPADRLSRPREILSPAAIRNGFASVNVAVSVPQGKQYVLHVAQNPDDAVTAALYRALHRQVGEVWVPDRLVRVEPPYTGTIATDVPGRKVDVFWLDMWVRRSAPVERVRVEVQLNVDDRWIIYPMEVRIEEPVVPSTLVSGARSATLPEQAEPSDGSAMLALRHYFCGLDRPTPPRGGPSIRHFILRNALQDVALARQVERSNGTEAVQDAILGVLKSPDSSAWCASPTRYRPFGAETWLRVRQAIWNLH